MPRHERADLVVAAAEEVIHARNGDDLRAWIRDPQLVRAPVFVQLRRDDERPIGHGWQLLRSEGHRPQRDADERDGVRAPATLEPAESRDRAEAVAGQRERQARSGLPGVGDRVGEVLRLDDAARPLAVARTDAAEIEA